MTTVENNGSSYDLRIQDGVLMTRDSGSSTWTPHGQMVNVVAANYVRPWIVAQIPDGTYRGTRIDDLALFAVSNSWDFDGSVAGITPIPIEASNTNNNGGGSTIVEDFAYISTPDQHSLLRSLQSFQHSTTHIIDSNGRIIDSPYLEGGAIVTPPPTNQLVAISLNGGSMSVGTTPTRIKPAQYWTRSVTIQSIRSDGTQNTGPIWVGGATVQPYIIPIGGFLQFDSPTGRSLDLSQIYVRSSAVGAQLNYLTMD
jgi:hypothetical protein